MKFALALTLGVLGGCADTRSSAPIENDGAPCHVAAQYIDLLLTKEQGRAVFVETPETMPLTVKGLQWNARNGAVFQTVPGDELLAKLSATEGTSVVKTCANIRSLLARKHVGYGHEAVEEAKKIGDNGAFIATVFGTSLPVMSTNGREALFLSSGVGAPEGGGGFVHYYRLSATNKWEEVSWAGLWIA